MDPAPDQPDAERRILTFPPRRVERADLEVVFERERGRLLRFLQIRLGSEVEAQDVAQCAFLRLWQRREALHGENLASLLFVTARNIAIDTIRVRNRTNLFGSRSLGDWDEAVAVKDPSAGPERILSATKDVTYILDLVEALPAKCRTAFVSYHFDQLTYAEIAERMNITESMVRKYVIRAVAYCATRFERDE